MAEEGDRQQTTVLVYVGKTENHIACIYIRTVLTLTGAVEHETNQILSIRWQNGNHKYVDMNILCQHIPHFTNLTQKHLQDSPSLPV